jgi:RNA polymerase sigma-70 factor (ECF subfamily)
MVATSTSSVYTKSYEPQYQAGSDSAQHESDELQAFNDLVLAYQDAVYRQAYWIMGDEDAAADATQEAFLRAFRNRQTFREGPFRPWIMKITTNYCLDQLRRRKTRKTLPLDIFDENDEEIGNPSWIKDPSGSIEDIVESSETQSWIMECINRLPVEYRTAVILVELQNMDYQEAASVMGIPLGTFKSRLARARLKLQKWLRPNECHLN